MPGWLLWTLVGLGAWCACSVAFAFLFGQLFGRRRVYVPAGRILFLAPRATRTRTRRRVVTRLH